MPSVEQLTDQRELARFLRDDAALHIYAIGDLDPFFWPHTKWWGLREADRLQAIALLYTGSDPPSLLALERHDPAALRSLVERISSELPQQFHAHVSPEVADSLPGERRPHGRHHKMLLTAPNQLQDVDVDHVTRFEPDDADALEQFYDRHYPGHWFTARMLETGQYFGVRDGDEIACVAGVHVYAPTQRVAALGNIATATTHRRQGLARRATARLCTSLLEHVDTIGLNVHAENAAAIRCYEQLGFDIVAEYDEFSVTR